MAQCCIARLVSCLMQRFAVLCGLLWGYMVQPETLMREGRVYGGGLHKLEPKELTNVSAQAIAELLEVPGAIFKPATRRKARIRSRRYCEPLR
jgi:hypothetical protein